MHECVEICIFRTCPGTGALTLVSQSIGGCELCEQVPSHWLLYLAQLVQPIGVDLRIPVVDITTSNHEILNIQD